MGSLREEDTPIRQLELEQFWRLNKLGQALQLVDPAHPELDEIRFDMELMAEITEWPPLREMCLRYLKNDAATRPKLPRVVVA